jgi:hypothetical protein
VGDTVGLAVGLGLGDGLALGDPLPLHAVSTDRATASTAGATREVALTVTETR